MEPASQETEAPNGSATPNAAYSDAYKKLVGDGIGREEYDLVGIIAYALYKKGKIEFLVSNGHSADDANVRNYHKTLTTTNVGALKSLAQEVLQTYANQLERAYNDTTREGTVNSELLRSIKGEFSGVRAHIETRTSARSAIVSGVISSLVFAVLLTIVASLQWQNPGLFLLKYIAGNVAKTGDEPTPPANGASAPNK